ncbi:MAG: DUF5722 domain-containing protein [Rhodopirellula sp. JB044]|uniref:DUF5722 domain-containing protein n=1 Tax=Rhodopirellula sp. JB044 TaxID=3342844 RepID=UPI00370A9A30
MRVPNKTNRENVQLNNGTVEIHGAALIEIVPQSKVSEGDWAIEFETFCVGGVEQMTLASVFGKSTSPDSASEDATPENQTSTPRSLPPFMHSETFRPHVAILEESKGFHLAGVDVLRLDLMMKDDAALQIRNVRLRRPRKSDLETDDHSSAYAAAPELLNAYLSRTFASKITGVNVGISDIQITGTVSNHRTGVTLADIPMETLLGDESPYRELIDIDIQNDGSFDVSVPRTTLVEGRRVDRLTDRWQLFHDGPSGNVAISHAHYADTVACRHSELPPAKPSSKKGLGGWSAQRSRALQNELKDLGITAVTVNVSGPHQYVSTRPHPNHTQFSWQGRDYYANERALQKLDLTFREAAENNVMVSAILLISNPDNSRDEDLQRLRHPDADPSGVYAMPAVTSSEGIDYYGAILNLMAERWSRDDGIHGRVHHWIVHNEVDFGWVWTNAGRKSDIAYMDLYQRSMRMTDLIVRQYDPHARTWISLTHHWAERGNEYGYGSKRMLDLLVQFCQTEGNFPWGLAYHPYPQSLFHPRTWQDHLATYQFDTPKITPKNLEVLDAYMKLPKNRYHGSVRPVHLSENGFNSKDYSDAAQQDQAAGMALAWKKIQSLSSIQVWHYHNWIDNRHEGGLRIGLRKFPDDQNDPLGKKQIWNLYQALGTTQEDAVADRYLQLIGVDSWEEILHRQKIQ